MNRGISRKELFSLSAAIFFAILFYCLRSRGSFSDCFEFIMGQGYEIKKMDMMMISGWCLLHTGHGIFLGTHLFRSQAETGYMALMRYGSYRKYYRKVWLHASGITLFYDAVTALSMILCSIFAHRAWGMAIEWEMLSQIVILNLCSHLFWGTLSAWFIVGKNWVKQILILYPGVVFWNILLCIPFPEHITKWFPANWMMLVRSNVILDGGFSVPAACGLLLALWAGITLIWLVPKNFLHKS